MKKFIIQSVLLLLVIMIGFIFFNPTRKSSPEFPFLPQRTISAEVQINEAKFTVEVAKTREKRNRGLGGREKMASDAGMLFIFEKEDKYPFWMKDLKFPLDFIWIKKDKIVDILQNIPPPVPDQKDESLPIYVSREPIDKVLEINGGTAERLNIKVGDIVKFKFL